MKVNLSTLVIVAVVVWYGWQMTRPSPVIPQPEKLVSESAVTVALTSLSYQSGMANLYRNLAERIERGEINTVEEFAKATYSRNKELRLAEREQLERLMAKRLGEETLDKPSAAAFLRELAQAYEEVQP